MKIFLEHIEEHIQNAETFVSKDPEDIFHVNMIKIFGTAKKEFQLLFAEYLSSNEELGAVKNQILVDKLRRFIQKYKAKQDVDIIYQLAGEMLETRINIVLNDDE